MTIWPNPLPPHMIYKRSPKMLFFTRRIAILKLNPNPLRRKQLSKVFTYALSDNRTASCVGRRKFQSQAD